MTENCMSLRFLCALLFKWGTVDQFARDCTARRNATRDSGDNREMPALPFPLFPPADNWI